MTDAQYDNIMGSLEEHIKVLKDIRMLLQQQIAFWNKITSEEYFNEVVSKDGIGFPQTELGFHNKLIKKS